MKKIILLLLMTLSFSGFGQKLKDSILSKKLDTYRHLTISLPPSYDRETKKVYPLLFLLDGDYLFDPFQGAISYGNYWDDLPEVIIVGLAQNRDNERDSDCTFDDSTGLPEGKGESFFEFIGGELLPFLQNKYRISPFKIIAGHDVTAGYMNLFLYKDNPLFNAYISLSPELATEMEVRVAERLGTFKQNMFYYQSSADGDIKKMRTKIATLDENIKAANNTSLNYKYDDFKGASHYSLVLYSIPSALYQFFAAYQPISTSEFQEKIVKLESGYVDYLKNKYEVLEKALGIKMPIRLNDFKAIEAAILKNKAYNEFELLAQLSKKMYPKSMLGDYHMAMYYENTGDIKNAVRYYQNGFQMQEIGDLTKDMMLGKADELRVQIKKK
ncbi:alpha/beta hydrolase-fold protein [Flavobacterium sp.]|uniref:alpha/beta hydrolase n=1 Tax=Flavobacterium sp. TaxID=239 RepID=UPI0026333E69|nr:alpha/beta hydrolase-fold protein [Flavobacterium sp.]